MKIYLDTLRRVREHEDNRLFGIRMDIDISNNFPLVTTRYINSTTVIQKTTELLNNSHFTFILDNVLTKPVSFIDGYNHYQFFLFDGSIHCNVYYRKCDMYTDGPIYIGVSALLVYMIAYAVNNKPGWIHVITGDTYVSNEHLTNVDKQLEQTPYPLCNLCIKRIGVVITNYMYIKE